MDDPTLEQDLKTALHDFGWPASKIEKVVRAVRYHDVLIRHMRILHWALHANHCPEGCVTCAITDAAEGR